MKKYLDVFSKLTFSDKSKEIAEKISVKKVTREYNIITLDLLLSEIISKENIDFLVSETLELFKKNNLYIKIKYNEKYALDQSYTLQRIYDEYKSSIDYELSKNGELLYRLYKSSEIVVSNTIHIILKDSIITHSKSEQLVRYLNNVFTKRFNFDVEIITDYIQKDKSEKELIKIKKEKERLDEVIKNIDNIPPQPPKKEAVNLQKSDKTNTKNTAKDSSDKSDVIYGKSFTKEVISISDITHPVEVAFKGEVISLDRRDYTNKYGKKSSILSYVLTDCTDSIKTKIFLSQEKADSIIEKLNVGAVARIKGIANYDPYDNGDLVIVNVKGIIKDTLPTRTRSDNATVKRVELHAHSKMSAKDAIASATEIVKTADLFGMRGVAITDHGVVHAFPEISSAAKKINAIREKKDIEPFKVLYGVEGYLVDDIQVVTRREHSYMLDDEYVVFDIETTGTNKIQDRIIEIGACKVKNGEITDNFSSLIDPKCSIPSYITRLTGIDNMMVKGLDTIDVVLKRFKEFVGDTPMVAHNADFDMGFIRRKGEELGIEFNNMSVDTVPISRKLITSIKKHKLDSLAKYFKIDLKNHHRAVDDALCLAKIFINLIDIIKKEGITNAKDLNNIGGLDVDSIRHLHKYHIIIIAKTQAGLKNLYEIISESHLKYLSGSGLTASPLIPRSLINKYRDGLIIGSACEAGELYQAVLSGANKDELKDIANFYDYLEVQPLDNNRFMIRSTRFPHINSDEDLININKKIIELADEINKPAVATSDVHFINPEDSIYRAMITAASGYDDYDLQPDLSFKTTEEMLEKFNYLPKDKAYEIVVKNTNKIFDMCDNVKAISDVKAPPKIPNSDKDLREICNKNAKKIYGDSLPDIVAKRLNTELDSIISNDYSVLYIIARKLVKNAEKEGYYVGSRGSVGSSFAATMAEITEINPLPPHYYCTNCKYSEFDSQEIRTSTKNGQCGLDLPKKRCPKCGSELTGNGVDIPFQTFLGFEGDKEPDIDLNFSGDYQSTAHKQTEEMFGKGYTYRAGTISGINDKSAIGYVKSYFEKKNIKKRYCEIIRLSSKLKEIRVTTGQHPGGIVVLPKEYDITDFTPVQKPANTLNSDVITTHFDYHSIDHNLLKLDILGHDNPTILKMLKDTTGVDFMNIDIAAEDIISIFSNASALGLKDGDLFGTNLGCLGIPEMGTETTMKLISICRPKNITDLLRISGLSHGTNVWENNAKDLIEGNIATLEQVISIRDDIMLSLIDYGVENKTAFDITEAVRKGKVASKQEKRWEEWKEILINANVPQWYINSCEKIEYMFPKAHAAAYVTDALRFAYYKIHYPKEFYSAYFSIRAKNFDYDMMTSGLDQTNYYLKTINEKIQNNQASDIEKKQFGTLRIIQEMQLRGIEFTPIDVYKANAVKFIITDGKIMPSFTALEGLGESQALSLESAAKNGRFLSVEDALNRTTINKTVLEYMNSKNMFGKISKTNQLTFL